MILQGSIVKYKEPASEFERVARFVVLDDPAEQIEAAKSIQAAHPAYRAKVDMRQLDSGLWIAPVRRAAIDEIELA